MNNLDLLIDCIGYEQFVKVLISFENSDLSIHQMNEIYDLWFMNDEYTSVLDIGKIIERWRV